MRILRINMTDLSSSFEDLPEDWKLLGGRALTAKILTAEVPPDTDPLGPDAKLIIANGPLAGTMAPCCGRLSVGAKSPLTMGIKEANAGGPAGQKMDRLGIRAIVVEGAAQAGKLHWVNITNDGVAIEDASGFKGMGNYGLVAALRDGCIDEKASVISIGMVGERCQKSSSVAFTDKDGHPSRHAARGGLGAVMGSKGLKAIAVDESGTAQVDINDQKEFRAVVKAWPESLKEDQNFKMMSSLGTPGLIAMLSRFGSMPTKNYTGEPTEGIEEIYGDNVKAENEKRGGRMDHCMPGCLVKCSVIIHDKEGKHVTSGFEYETCGLLGTNLGIASLDAIAEFDRKCDDMGVDTIETGSALGVASSAGKFELGDIAAVHGLLDEIKEGTGLGTTLADGVVATAKALGVDRVPAFGGQAIPAHDPRITKPTGVTYHTSPMGADHTAGITYAMDDETAVGLSLKEQIVAAFVDAMGICTFGVTGDRKRLVEFLKDLMNARFGTSLTDDDIVNIGRETLRDELAFNKGAEFGTVNAPAPDFIRTEALPSGALFGVVPAEIDAIWDKLDTLSVFE